MRRRRPRRGLLDRLALDGHRRPGPPGRVPGGVTPASAECRRPAPVGPRTSLARSGERPVASAQLAAVLAQPAPSRELRCPRSGARRCDAARRPCRSGTRPLRAVSTTSLQGNVRPGGGQRGHGLPQRLSGRSLSVTPASCPCMTIPARQTVGLETCGVGNLYPPFTRVSRRSGRTADEAIVPAVTGAAIAPMTPPRAFELDAVRTGRSPGAVRARRTRGSRWRCWRQRSGARWR